MLMFLDSTKFQKDFNGGSSGVITRLSKQSTEGVALEKVCNFVSKVGERSFAEVVNNGRNISATLSLKPPVHMKYQTDESELVRFKKTFVGFMINPGMACNIQTSFEIEGYFSIKVTPIGANICFLEESEHMEIRDIVKEVGS